METTDFTDSEKKLLDLAFSFANEALESQEVPVGCIFVHNEEVIANGRNTVNETRNSTRHAEMNCIDDVVTFCKGKSLNHEQVFREIEVYVTVEPCIMCASALLDLQVKKIVYGCNNDRFGGVTVFDVTKLLNRRTLLKSGYKSMEAMELLREFYKGTNPSAPPDKVKVKGKKGRKPKVL